MNVLNQNVLDNYVSYLKNNKYKNVLQELKLDYDSENGTDFIFLLLIKIKRHEHNKGWGSKVLKDIVQVANKYNVQVRLWITAIYGMNLNRLMKFYMKQGFVLDHDDYMIYTPKKIRKNCNKLE
jgi:GNAT superfamily N-acetyltransferase